MSGMVNRYRIDSIIMHFDEIQSFKMTLGHVTPLNLFVFYEFRRKIFMCTTAYTSTLLLFPDDNF